MKKGKQVRIDWLLKKVVAAEQSASPAPSAAPQQQQAGPATAASPAATTSTAAGTSLSSEQLAGQKRSRQEAGATPNGARHRRRVVEDDDSDDAGQAAEQHPPPPQQQQQQQEEGQEQRLHTLFHKQSPTAHSRGVRSQPSSATKQASAHKRRRTLIMPALLDDADMAPPARSTPAGGSKSDDDAPPSSSRRRRCRPTAACLSDSDSPSASAQDGIDTATAAKAAGRQIAPARLRQPQAQPDMDAVLKRLHDRQKKLLAPSAMLPAAIAADGKGGPGPEKTCKERSLGPDTENGGPGSDSGGSGGREGSKLPWWEEARQRQRQQRWQDHHGDSEENGEASDPQHDHDADEELANTPPMRRLQRQQHPEQQQPEQHQQQQQREGAAFPVSHHSSELEDSLSSGSPGQQQRRHAAASDSASASSSDEDLADFVVSDEEGGSGLSDGAGREELDQAMAGTRARMAPESEAFELYLRHLVDTECGTQCRKPSSCGRGEQDGAGSRGRGRQHSSRRRGREAPRSSGTGREKGSSKSDGKAAKGGRLRQRGAAVLLDTSNSNQGGGIGGAHSDADGGSGDSHGRPSNSSGDSGDEGRAGLVAAERIESKLCLMREMCVGSAAWRSAHAEFVRALGERPVCGRVELGRGAGMHSVRCEACGRDRHVTMRLVLKGEPTAPNWQFGARPSAIAAVGGTPGSASRNSRGGRAQQQHSSLEPYEALVGRQCAARVSLYHALLHFRTSLVAKLRRELRRGSRGAAETSADQAAARERVVAQQAEPLYRAYCLLLEAADQFVTLGSGGAGWTNSSAYDLDAVDSVLARLS